MLDAVGTLLAGVVFGVALAAPPGPMNAVIAEESVTNGWTAGVRAGLGAMSADALFFLLALAGAVGFVERFPTVRAAMVGVGGVLMLFFAYDAVTGGAASFRAADTDADAEADEGTAERDGDTLDGGADPNTSRGFRKAFVLALTNPYQILFWLTIGVGLLDPGRVDVLAETPYVGDALVGALVVETGSPALVVGFFAGIGLWVVGFPTALIGAERRVESFAPATAGASALVLGGFGVAFLADAVGTLIGAA